MPSQKMYRIGTRGSLLALTQCNQVKNQLEKLTGDKFELEIIKTQGDMITNAPLWQLDGKDFFTKELDEALLSGAVDLVVHSYKDLGSVRPDEILLAAITKRSYAHDILLIKKDTISEIKNKAELFVGTSSPRRMVNLKNHLKNYLPNATNLTVTTKVLRGNVNTRIQKLKDNEYDAIVLALPGIERLALTESSRNELKELLSGLTFLVLPQSVFPSSAAQGALGIECLKNRSDNGELLNKLKKMECTDTKDEVKREREKFNAYGGGCHLAVGIHVKKIGPYFLHIHRGVLNDLDVVYTQLEGANRPKLNGPLKTFIGLPNFDDTLIEKLPHVRNLDTSAHYLVSSKYSIPSIDNETEYGSIWASGTKTMMELCKKGIWVHGCADGLGKKEVEHLLDSKAISLMINSTLPLINLTHSDGENALKTYTRKINSVSKEFETKLNEAEIFYWSSYPQYECFVEKYPFIKNKIHAVGIGKTYRQFKHEKIDVLPFYSLEEFNNWAKK